MKLLSTITLCLLLPYSAAAQQPASPAAGGAGRVVFGVVAAATPAEGVVVERVAQESPAARAGLQPGDCIVRVNAVQVKDKQALRDKVGTCRPGEVIRVEYLREGKRRFAFVELAVRTEVASEPAPLQATTARVAVPYEMRVQMAQARARIRLQLEALPWRTVPSAVVADLHELRNLALSLRGADVGAPRLGEGEAELEFADSDGYLMLHTAGGQLHLIVKDNQHREQARYPLNTRMQCRALPPTLVRRLQAL